MNNLPCEIVQDLLPSYVDGLTHPVTTQAVQEHLEACPSCRDSHRRMSQKSEASDDSNWEKWQTFVKLNQKRRRRIRLRIILLGILGLCTLLVLFAPLPTHTVRAYHGIRQSAGQEVPVTAKLDYWTFDFLLFEDRFSGSLVVDSGSETAELELLGDALSSDPTGSCYHMGFTVCFAGGINHLVTGFGDASLDRLMLSTVTDSSVQDQLPYPYSFSYVLGTGDITTDEVSEALSEFFVNVQ